jgi:ankyrin repeat protein
MNADVSLPGPGGSPALDIAVCEGQAAIAKILLEKGRADPNQKSLVDGSTPLVHAAALGKDECVEVLLTHGADPNATNAKGQSALLIASRSGFASIVKLLLQRGANPNIADSVGRKPLDKVASNGDASIAHELLVAGASAGHTMMYDEDDCMWHTPLTLASAKLNEDVASSIVTPRQRRTIAKTFDPNKPVYWAN